MKKEKYKEKYDVHVIARGKDYVMFGHASLDNDFGFHVDHREFGPAMLYFRKKEREREREEEEVYVAHWILQEIEHFMVYVK